MREGFFVKIKKLLYGVGLSFLAGAMFYLFFRQSFRDVYNEIGSSMTKWQQEKGIMAELYHSLWNHGKFFVILWILSVNRTAVRWYIRLFLGFTGIRNGFLFLFFVMNRGWMGGKSVSTLYIVFPDLPLFFWTHREKKAAKTQNASFYHTAFCVYCCLFIRSLF